MENFFYSDNSFAANKSTIYELSIKLSHRGISVSIFDTVNKKVVVLRHINFDIVLNNRMLFDKVSNILKNDAQLKRKYKNVKIVFVTPKVTLVPISIYTKKDERTFFNFNHIISESDTIVSSIMTEFQTVCLFVMPENVKNKIDKQFDQVEYYHDSISKIQQAPENNKTSINLTISNDNFIGITACRGKKIALHNTYAYNSETDILYHILNVYKQLDANRETDSLKISGLPDAESSVFILLKRYIANIEFCDVNKNIKLSEKIDKKVARQLSGLINLA